VENQNALEEYYRDHYFDVQRTGVQGWGNSLIDRLVERRSRRSPGDRILEIGAASGEHLQWVSPQPSWSEYVALDLMPAETNPRLAAALERDRLLRFVKGSAEEIPFADNYFDVCLSTCVLAHVSRPEDVFTELRRVTRPGGNVTVGMPCDPGLVNRLVKTLVTYPSMRRSGIPNPQLQYAHEHVNGVGNLITLAKAVFHCDAVRFSYFPSLIHSWNLNLAVVLHVVVGDKAAAE